MIYKPMNRNANVPHQLMTRLPKNKGVAWWLIFAIMTWLVVWRWMVNTPLSTDVTPYATLIVTATLFIALAVYCYFFYWIKAIAALLWIWALGVIVEYIGIRTCIPYGCFEYSEYVWPQFFWTFPYALFFIWPIIVVLMAQAIGRCKEFFALWSRPLGLAFVWWLLLVLLDLFLDPVAVHQGLWSYVWWGARYGVPIQNYLWWIFTWTLSSYWLVWLVPKIIDDKLLRILATIMFVMYLSWFFFL